MKVEEHEHPHHNLTVHAVGETTMSRDGVSPVLNHSNHYLDFDDTLQAGSEEPTERSDDTGEGGQDESMYLYHCEPYLKQPEMDYSLPIYQFSFNYSLKN